MWGQAKDDSKAKEQKLPKCARAGNEVEALWEGKWWKAIVVSTSRNKWVAEVEWVEEGGVNQVSLDDIRPLPTDSPVSAASGTKKPTKEQLRKEKEKAKEKREREAEKAAERRAREGIQREIDEKREVEERKGRAQAEESRAAVMKQVEGVLKLVVGLACIPMAMISLLVSIVALSGAALLGSVTWVLPYVLILAPLTYLLKGQEDKFTAASVLKAAIDADCGITDSPREKTATAASGGKKKSGKEKKAAAAERQQEEMEAAKKQTQTLVRLFGVTVLVVGAMIGVSLLDLRKEAKGPDYYGLLGVDLDAGEQAVMASYKKLSRAWHPDKYRGAEQEEAKAKMMLLNEAKATLLDPAKRKEYNEMRDLTSKLGYEEASLTYAAKHHWIIEAYLSCPEVFEGATGAVVCSAFPLAHIVWHPILAYAYFSWAHFGDVPLARRRGANAACLTGILLAAASLASGFFLLSAFPNTVPIVCMVACCLPLAYMVDFFLITKEVTETKTFTGVGRPIIKTETTLIRPSWLPSLVSYETLIPALSSYFKMLQQDVEHVECADGESRLVGTARMAELKELPSGYLK